MPRGPRKCSSTQIYHVMLRGNEKKNIFIDDEDKTMLMDIMLEKKRMGEFLLYSYCILDNHVHIVIKEMKDPLPRIMGRIATSYAQYFNKKYKRVGHVFQDRYKSENIEDENYLMCVIRYIHNNPQKAGICSAGQYKWSTLRLYLDSLKSGRELPEIRDVLSIFSDNEIEAVKAFAEFSKKNDNDSYMDIEQEGIYDIDEGNVEEYIRSCLKERGITLQDLRTKNYRKIREELIKELVEHSCLSKRRIAELTGINRETVRKLSKEPSP